MPSERHYWSNDGDIGVEGVRNSMSRTSFLKLKAYIHSQDNEKHAANKTDRGFKVRPLINMLNENFQKFGMCREQLAVDEMIVKYFGMNLLKQFIRGKPIRFGYKMWALCDAEGFCYKFQLYCGKGQERRELPLRKRVVRTFWRQLTLLRITVSILKAFFTSR